MNNVVVIEDPINPVDEVQGLETITHLLIPTNQDCKACKCKDGTM
jgi:hypothetical protein